MQHGDALSRCPLFDGIAESELNSMLGCLCARVVKFDKNEYIFREGDVSPGVCIVIRGCVHIIREDSFGGRAIIASALPTQLFGEAFACVGERSLPVGALAADDCEIMFLDVSRMISSCEHACAFHKRMIHNLLRIVAQSNMRLNEKIEVVSKRTIRRRLLAYLSIQSGKSGSDIFIIPFDRQQLADYIGVERSALSAEISKLCREGIIEAHRSSFRILSRAEVDE